MLFTVSALRNNYNNYTNEKYVNNSRLNLDPEGYIKPPLYEKSSSMVRDTDSYHWTSSPENSEKAWFIKLSYSYKGVGIDSYKKLMQLVFGVLKITNLTIKDDN